MGFINWLANIDRRIIFVFIAASVIVPLIFPIGMPVKVTPQAKAIYDTVEALPEGSNILVAFDYDPAAVPECHPMAIAFLRHCFEKKHHVIVVALWPQGAQLAVSALSEVAREYGAKYGEDYVNLGYKAGGGIVIKSMGSSIADVFPTDMTGKSIKDLPLMAKINNLHDIALVMDLSAGDPGLPAWVAIANALYHVKVAGGCTAVSAPQFFPYLQTGQLVGLLGGLKGAAEYEALINVQGRALRRMDAQSVAHLVIIIFIIFANIAYFVLRKKMKDEDAAKAAGPA